MLAEHSNNGSPSLTELANRFGSDKGTNPGDWGFAHEYATVYERFLSARRFEPLRLLEIGVWKGGSLRMWESYLPNAQIIGIENLPEVIELKANRAEILIGDASDEQFLNDTVDRFYGRRIDIVIDDASHILDQQVRTFELLFPFLEEGGLYFVEDISGSRFRDGNRGLLPFFDFLDYSWNLTQQTTFFPDDHPSTYHNIRDLRSLSPAERDQVRGSFWNSNLGSVHYFHDLCVLEKVRRPLEVDLKQTDVLRPSAGISYQLRKERLRSDGAEISTDGPRLKDQVDTARGKLRSVWNFIFRLQAEHVTESARLKAELAMLGQQIPEFQAALVDLQRQNNALRLENAELKQARERISSALAKRKAETIQIARERDEVRSKIAVRLTSKLWLFKRLFHF